MKKLSLTLFILICCQSVLAEAVVVKKIWQFKTTLGLNLNQTFNQAFIGLQNGVGFSPGFHLDESIQFYHLPHEWRTELTLSEAWTLTTPQRFFIKSSDSLNLKSSYLYHALSWLGPYGSAKLRTSIFPSDDVETSSTKYDVTDAATGKIKIGEPSINGTTETCTQFGNCIFPLTKAFLPLILEQDVGVFAQPFHEDNLLLEFRAGLTAREIIAHGQRILTAVGVVYGNTPVRQLNNVFELGPSAGLQFKGDVLDKKVSYRISCDAMYSLFRDFQGHLASPNPISIDLSTGIAFNLLSWLSIHWQFKGILNPAILDQFQMMSNLSLAVNYSS